jgi:citrate lyase subunit beta/citryl-CoA lyase
VPAHGVVTEFRDQQAFRAAASRAANEFGYTRMWSIHPDQIRSIVELFAPSKNEIHKASQLLRAAEQADWAPISFDGKLEDRASYRYYWQVLERAHQTGRSLPDEAREWFARSQSHGET